MDGSGNQMKVLPGKKKTSALGVEWAKENCVLCGRETCYNFATPVMQRAFYVEGAGQLCRKCFQELYSDRKTNKQK